jgi:putative transposase
VLVRRRDGRYFLHVQLSNEAAESIEVKGVIGVDMGVKNLAVTDDGETFSGDGVEACRRKYHRIRVTCQRTRTKSSKRKRRKVRAKEGRYKKDVNHVISRRVIDKAKGTGCAIGIEDLEGISKRTTVRKADRCRMKGWAFHQLRTFLTYKALAEGVPVIPVDPRNTSRTCSECGHCERANRKSRGDFECRRCGLRLPADWNAARNIRDRAAVMRLNAGIVDAGGRIPVEIHLQAHVL